MTNVIKPIVEEMSDEEWQEKLKRLKRIAKRIEADDPLVTVRDPKTGKTRNVHRSELQKTKSLGEIKENVSAGSGAIAGIGIGPQGEPGVNMRRDKGITIFTVPTLKFMNARVLKRKYQRFENYINDPTLGKQISEYANRHFNEAIVLEDERTGAMCFLRYGK